MKNRLFITLLTWVTICALVLVSCNQKVVTKPIILNVSSGLSLKSSLLEIKELYYQQKPNVTINCTFNSSGLLQKAIEQGGDVDILMIANPKIINELESKGFLVPETRQVFLGDKMVLLTPKNTTGISNFKDLTTAKVNKIAIPDPKSASSGKYTIEIFNYLGILKAVKSKLVLIPTSAQVVSSLEDGKTDAGIAFATEAILSNKVKVAAIAPEKSHDPIVYTLVVLKNSKNISEAKEFAQFLVSDPAGSAFVKYGFTLNAADKTK